MNWIRKHRPSPATAIALVALVVALGGAAFAAIPDSSGTIHGCYQKTNGGLRVVESSGECRTSENALAWNRQGPPGPPGGGAAGFDEKPDLVSTNSDTPTDLGGPSVTVKVGQSGLVAVFARVDLGGERDKVNSQVLLSEAPDIDPPAQILRGTGQQPAAPETRKWTTPTDTSNPSGTSQRVGPSWLVFEATPGMRTFTLKYARSCVIVANCAPTDLATFRNRHLWVVPVD